MSEVLQRKIAERMRTGRYASEEEVLLAGLAALEDQESFGDFEPGELADLVAEGRRSAAEHGTIPARTVFEELRQRSAERRQTS
jgi:Arc/MetJ-type ribon-helix-helix transcriptional regulator